MTKKVNPHTLRNKVNRQEMRRRLMAEEFQRTTISFYRYVRIADPQAMRDKLWIEWSKLNVFGRIYVSQEGINAQLSVPEFNFDAFRDHVDSFVEFNKVPFKIAVEDDGKSFFKLDVKVRKKIVADGLDDDAFDVTDVGEHLTPEKFNQLLDNPETVCIDMRNNYEARIGHFDGAVCPDVETFRDELPESVRILEQKNHDKDKPVILYCTGGIRCEKASAFLKHNGYRNVGQLHGGIIEYAHQVKAKGLPNKFRGKNFVFDERIAEGISDEVLSNCDQCGEACDAYTNCGNVACNLLFIQCEKCREQFAGTCCAECREFVQLPEDQQKQLRKGKKCEKRYVRS